MAAAIIFDLDGTLVTFNLDIRQWRRVLIDELEKQGFDTAGLELNTPTQKILDFAKTQAGAEGAPRFVELKRAAFSILDSLELEGAAVATVFPGTASALELLRARGLRLCVLTNSGRVAAFQTLRKFDLLRFFEFVLTRDDTETMKPSPQGLTQAVARLGVRPDQVYYVGDSSYDIMAAKGAGIGVISVATGNYTAERLRNEGSDHVIAALSELPKILGV